MNKIKAIAIIILILFMEAVNVYLGMLDARLEYQIMYKLQDHMDQPEETNVMEDWIADEYDKTDWWMEHGAAGAWRNGYEE